MATEDEDTVEVEAGSGGPQRPLPPGDCHGNLFVAHQEDCHKYYLCNFGQLTELACPSGLVWNLDHCDWPENAKCRLKPGGSLFIR